MTFDPLESGSAIGTSHRDSFPSLVTVTPAALVTSLQLKVIDWLIVWTKFKRNYRSCCKILLRELVELQHEGFLCHWLSV